MSISFIIPCKNEEDNILDTVNEIIKSTKNTHDYEIIIINDCSNDNTEFVIKEICQNNSNITLINNNKNLGYGGSFIKALDYAKKEYVNLIPGDNCFEAKEISKMINNLNDFDLITSIPKEIHNRREKHRKFFSRAFTIVVNLLFGYKMKYYNGIPVVRNQIIKKINIKSKSPFFMAEIVLKILKLNLKYDEREIFFVERKFGKTAIFNLKTIFKTIIDLIKLRFNY